VRGIVQPRGCEVEWSAVWKCCSCATAVCLEFGMFRLAVMVEMFEFDRAFGSWQLDWEPAPARKCMLNSLLIAPT
jgi:hypothetical protein